MALEALDYTLIHRLYICYEIWFEVCNVDILKTIGNNVAQEIVL